jgi:hypothetical protein
MGTVQFPLEDGREIIFAGGVMIEIAWSQGKGHITVTVGDNWELTTQLSSGDQFAARRKEVLRSAAERVSISLIECGNGCHATLLAALKAGQNRFEAMENYRNCIARCYGVGPE